MAGDEAERRCGNCDHFDDTLDGCLIELPPLPCWVDPILDDRGPDARCTDRDEDGRDCETFKPRPPGTTGDAL